MKSSILALSGLSVLATARPAVNSTASRLVSRQSQNSQDQPYQAGDFWFDPYTNVYAVSAEMTVGGLNYNPNGPQQQAAAFWVGIWGSSCGFDSGLLQTGITGSNSGDGDTWSAWYEWFPAGSVGFDIAINEGDQVSFQVVANSPTTGTATVSNLSSGQKASVDISGNQLCQSNAIWVVEDFLDADNSQNTNSALADFGTVTMTNCLAIADSQYFNAGDGGIANMVQNGQSQVNVDVDGSTVTLQYA